MLNSLLYVPATSERFIRSAARSDADAVILDLEDAIPEGDKATARNCLPAAVPLLAQAGRQVYVRVNHRPHLLAPDVRAAIGAGTQGLVLPKVDDPHALTTLDEIIAAAGQVPRPLPIIVLIESPAGVLNANAIAAHARASALVCGGEDLASELGASPTNDVLRIPKILVHLAAKANHKLSLGLLQTVANYQDLDALERSAKEARAFGFDGSTCIHPTAVPILNKTFRPGEQELADARRLLDAATAHAADGVGAFVFEGRFIDEAMLRRARALLNR